jgi:Predicted transcriptional regulators
MNNNLGFCETSRHSPVRRGLSKSGLARAVHVSTTCVWNWEEGNTFPRPEALARIATALGTTPAYLERGEPPSSSDRDQVSSETGPDKVDSARSNLAEIVRTARAQIATAAGLELGQVKIILEYGN